MIVLPLAEYCFNKLVKALECTGPSMNLVGAKRSIVLTPCEVEEVLSDFAGTNSPGAKLKLWAPPSKPDAVTTVHALKAEIEAGRLPKASLVAANANTAVELQTLVKAHGLADKAAIAIVILYGEAPENAKKMWVHVQAAGGAPRAHKVPVVPLGAKLPDPPTTNVKTVEPPKELADTQVLRITIPHCFAGSRWKSARQRPANAILDLLHESQLVEGLVATYGWKAVGDEVESVTGYIRATSDTIPKLLKLSGNRGIFFESLAKDRTNAPVEWIVQGDKGKVVLVSAWLLMLSQVTATLLRANEWHEVELVAQPTKQRGWLFRAVNRDAVCFAYEVGNTICISISRFFHAAKAPKQSRIAYAGRRLSRDTEDAWSRDVGPKGTQKQSGPIPMETEETSDVPATALDDPSQKDLSEQPKRSSGQGNSPEKKRAKAEVVDDKSNDTLHSFTILDFGGDGDCAYRAGAAAYALAGNRPKAEVVKNAGQLGATLRAQITSHLRRHAIYESTFVPDSRWTPEREAGVVPSTYSEWIEATARPKRSGSYLRLAFRLTLVKLEVSYVLPPDQQGWACPITGCDAALPALPRQDHKRAVAKHISDCHPGYTPRSLFALRAKIFKKPAVATMLTEKYAKQRAKLYKTHEIVKVVSPERLAKGERGNLYYCKRCLFQLKQDRHGGCHTCTQNLKRMKQKEVVTCQRRMWTNLKKNFPKHAANYAEAVGKTFAELDRVFQVRSINVGRGNGAWEAFQLAQKHKIDILALQEDGLKSCERHGFIRHVCKSQYRIYDAPARVRKHQAWGGAMLLVHSRLRSTQIDTLSCDDCQCVTARVENITFSSCYQVPAGARLPLAQHLTEMQVLMPAGSVFAAVGDFNDTPSETCILQDAASPGLTAMFARLANGAPAPTRWEGNRCIDYLVTNSCSNFTPVRLLETEAIADHKILHFDAIFDTEQSAHPWRLQKHVDLSRPAEATESQIDALWVEMSAVRERVLAECQNHGPLPPLVNEWSAVTAVEFAACASRLKGKAGGLDGWSGDEICSLPPGAFDLFARFCACCESSGRLPTAWQLAKQSHLPKACMGIRQADGARDVCGLRPLSVFSCWYRLWASARLRSRDANAWCQRWWPDQAIGGKKKKEIYNALAPLFDRATRGHYIISLDFSLAFDFCDPEIAVFIMKQFGLPHGLSTMLLQQWTHQQLFKFLRSGSLGVISCAPESKVTDKPIILGTVFRGARQRRHCDKENTRIDDVLSLIARATFLPVSWQTKRMVVAAGPLAKAEFGWCLKPPTLEVCRKVQRAVKKALHEPRYASPDLRDALRGHRLHFGFRALTATFAAARRVLDKEPARLTPGLWDWNLGWSAAIHAMMKRYGWEFMSPWHWKHSITHASVSLNKSSPHWCSSAESALHQLREGFRAHFWNEWQNSQRNDNLCCPVIDYNSQRCKLALKQVSGCPDRFAVLTGAYCSPAAYGVATSSNDLCPFCKMVAGHSAHTYWACTHMCEGRPRRPDEALQARLGWPRGLQPSYDEAVLAWMVRVRKAVLSHRYGDVT
ncbi:hypothetical protein AK812_SmicGene16129 [Symbiodinium microadriaticum]|uniref:Uncharacterized protein n=1 Tax=Symbiodinium microadriaticum TaxID=2951 RepID=A0A1Q9E143_SYMMI|nr:hypothetical protein AK812_SmicGene16129 [Symbiodinium microadriaticum]